MKQFFSLVAILFKARYKFRIPNKEERQKAAFNKKAGFQPNAAPVKEKKDNTWVIWVVLIFAFLPMLFILASGVAQIAPMFAAENALTELMMVIYVITMLVVIIMGIVNMLSYVYFNRDSEFLAGLPIKNWKIFLAKLFVVYISELALAAVSLIPLNLTIAIVTGQGALFYAGTVLSVLLVPAMPMLLASILAIPLMFIVSYFRKKNAMTSIVLILLFGTIFGLYYYFYTRFMRMTDAELNTEVFYNLIMNIKVLENALYPIAALIRFCLMESVFGLSPGLSAVINLGIVIGSFVIIAFIAGFIANLVYHKSVISQSVNANQGKAKSEAYKSAGVFMALLKKEWRALIRESAFAFQCLSGIVIGPILTVFLGSQFKIGDLSALDSMQEIAPMVQKMLENLPSVLLVFMCLFACAGMNIAACSAISREGKTFYATKIMPVPYSTQIKAKLLLSYIISVIGCLITSLLGVILMKLPVWQFLLIFAFVSLYAYVFACFALKFDINKPRLNWSTPNEAVKNSRNSTLPVLLNMAISLFLAGIMIVFAIFNLIAVMWIVLFAAAGGLAWLFHRLLFKNIDAVYENIEN